MTVKRIDQCWGVESPNMLSRVQPFKITAKKRTWLNESYHPTDYTSEEFCLTLGAWYIFAQNAKSKRGNGMEKGGEKAN